jgi:putative spermidine/putrescine transport system substrate-binding protein
MLDPSAQKLFAERMGYLPTVDNCTLTGETAEQLAFPTPTPKIVVPDYAVTSKALPEMQEWWKKSIQHT